jgi:hypothetical protein
LADLLIEKGYSVHLANPCGIQKYSGLKHADDKHDAFWLAHLKFWGQTCLLYCLSPVPKTEISVYVSCPKKIGLPF